MKTLNFFKTGLSIIVILVMVIFNFQNSYAQEICIQSGSDQITGTQNGYRHELWNQNSQGTACMTVGSGATFSGQWSGIQNYLARRGLGYNQTQEHQDIGTFNATYTCSYNPTCSVNGQATGNSYLAVYGWTVQPLVEYYIVENWCNWNPSKATENATSYGIKNIGGVNYEIIKVQQYGKPSIQGQSTDFTQYFSVRQNLSSSGSVAISDHFNIWESLGMNMGKMHEVSFLVEGYQNGGSFSFSALDVTVATGPYVPVTGVTLTPATLSLGQNETSQLTYTVLPANATNKQVGFASANWVAAGVSPTGLVTGHIGGSSTITVYTKDGDFQASTVVTINDGVDPLPVTQSLQLRALGTTGDEVINLLQDGNAIAHFNLSTTFQTYTHIVHGGGNLRVEFANDDGIQNGRNVRLDYVSIDGAKRETEAMAVNTGAYANGVCGGGAYTEWIHCNGSVDYGTLPQKHTVRIRARGNNGGEHIDLLINGQSVNNGWTLGTSYQEYTATVTGDGDIRVEYDNDGGLKDAVIDWLKVDSQTPRQAENMQYNTGAYANGRCGGGSYSQWMQCNGVIGFGKISDNFNARLDVSAEPESTVTVEHKNSGVRVYPNPSAGSVSILFDESVVNATVKIYDAMGKVAYVKQNIRDKEIQVSDLASGVYIVNVNNNGFQYRNKLIIR